MWFVYVLELTKLDTVGDNSTLYFSINFVVDQKWPMVLAINRSLILFVAQQVESSAWKFKSIVELAILKKLHLYKCYALKGYISFTLGVIHQIIKRTGGTRHCPLIPCK
jgi:hypothetical protein